MTEPTNLASPIESPATRYAFDEAVCDPHENPEALQSQPLPPEENASFYETGACEEPAVAVLVQAQAKAPAPAPAPASDPALPFNPVKLVVGATNGVQGVTEVIGGIETMIVGAAAFETGPVGAAIAAAGAVEVAKGCESLHMAYQQVTEAAAEDSSDAAWQNLLGVVPFVGSHIDDPGELF